MIAKELHRSEAAHCLNIRAERHGYTFPIIFQPAAFCNHCHRFVRPLFTAMGLSLCTELLNRRKILLALFAKDLSQQMWFLCGWAFNAAPQAAEQMLGSFERHTGDRRRCVHLSPNVSEEKHHSSLFRLLYLFSEASSLFDFRRT